jgi:hypothetical protein
MTTRKVQRSRTLDIDTEPTGGRGGLSSVAGERLPSELVRSSAGLSWRMLCICTAGNDARGAGSSVCCDRRGGWIPVFRLWKYSRNQRDTAHSSRPLPGHARRAFCKFWIRRRNGKRRGHRGPRMFVEGHQCRCVDRSHRRPGRTRGRDGHVPDCRERRPDDASRGAERRGAIGSASSRGGTLQVRRCCGGYQRTGSRGGSRD